MGLTIHYEFQTRNLNVTAARELLDNLRRAALHLPFQFVGSGLEEFTGAECANEDPNDDLRWLKVQATRYLARDENYYAIQPTHILALVTSPGKGSEPAIFGLCRYPETITVEGVSVTTQLQGWSWAGACKTQYASNPALGGIHNFLRCHLSVISLLDSAHRLGLVNKISDESGYWERRDRQELTRMVDKWNRMMAGFAGRLIDECGVRVKAAITEYPNFEHLEALAQVER